MTNLSNHSDVRNSFGSDSSNAQTTQTPFVTVSCDGEPWLQISAILLADTTSLSMLSERIATASSVYFADWAELLELPTEGQANLLLLLRRSRGQILACNPRLNQYLPLFESTLALRVLVQDLKGIGRWRQLAVGIIATFHSREVEDATERMVNTHIGAGGTRLDRRLLSREIREQIQLIAGQIAAETETLAEKFLTQLHERRLEGLGNEMAYSDLQTTVPPLRYFQDEFYELRPENRWQKTSVKQLRAELAEFARLSSEFVTERLINNAVLGIQGRVLIGDWTLSLPVFYDDTTKQACGRRLVTFANGQVDLDMVIQCRITQLLPYDPRWFSTSVLPYAFDAAAECPAWLQFLGEILPREHENDHRQEVIQEFMGWTLLPGDCRYEKMLICHGHGRNGKSTLFAVWESLLGSENVSRVSLDHLGSEFRIGDLVSKLANIVCDMSYIDKAHEGLLKQIVTGERIQINRKNKEPITARPTAKMIFACNELPQFNDRTDGTWRRLIAVPFTRQVPECQIDVHLAERLGAELPGIFNWALEGLLRLNSQRRFTECALCSASLAEQRHSSDPLRSFFDECCVVGADNRVETGLFFAAFKSFCGDVNRKPRAESEIGKQMKAIGIDRVRESTGSRKYYYSGIDLTAEARRVGMSASRR